MTRSNGPSTPYSRSTTLKVPQSRPLKYLCKGEELVHCSTARTESVLFLLNLRFDNQPEPPPQHPGMSFPQEAE